MPRPDLVTCRVEPPGLPGPHCGGGGGRGEPSAAPGLASSAPSASQWPCAASPDRSQTGQARSRPPDRWHPAGPDRPRWPGPAAERPAVSLSVTRLLVVPSRPATLRCRRMLTGSTAAATSS